MAYSLLLNVMNAAGLHLSSLNVGLGDKDIRGADR